MKIRIRFGLNSLLKQKRDKLKAFLEENKIPTMIYYPIPLHKQKAYKKFRILTNPLVNSEDACNQVISIPIHGYISNLEVDKVISYINKFLKINETQK